jgi:hypothetical protein
VLTTEELKVIPSRSSRLNLPQRVTKYLWWFLQFTHSFSGGAKLCRISNEDVKSPPPMGLNMWKDILKIRPVGLVQNMQCISKQMIQIIEICNPVWWMKKRHLYLFLSNDVEIFFIKFTQNGKICIGTKCSSWERKNDLWDWDWRSEDEVKIWKDDP